MFYVLTFSLFLFFFLRKANPDDNVAINFTTTTGRDTAQRERGSGHAEGEHPPRGINMSPIRTRHKNKTRGEKQNNKAKHK